MVRKGAWKWTFAVNAPFGQMAAEMDPMRWSYELRLEDLMEDIYQASLKEAFTRSDKRVTILFDGTVKEEYSHPTDALLKLEELRKKAVTENQAEEGWAEQALKSAQGVAVGAVVGVAAVGAIAAGAAFAASPAGVALGASLATAAEGAGGLVAAGAAAASNMTFAQGAGVVLGLSAAANRSQTPGVGRDELNYRGDSEDQRQSGPAEDLRRFKNRFVVLSTKYMQNDLPDSWSSKMPECGPDEPLTSPVYKIDREWRDQIEKFRPLANANYWLREICHSPPAFIPNASAKQWHPREPKDGCPWHGKSYHPCDSCGGRGGDLCKYCVAPSCDGQESKCPYAQRRKEQEKKGLKPLDPQCWRVRYFQKLQECKNTGGIFLQILEKGTELGPGQKEEVKWATNLGLECWHTFDGMHVHRGFRLIG
ncbi:unnamed protein product [Symbiodinium sp. CCMP2592]|nr:unnamed protein product [Symbiodinium sp. CCMP2592]